MTLQNDTSSTVNSPNLINATLRGKYITLQFDNVLSDTLPSTRKFTLNQGNRQYQIIDSEIRSSEGVVTLTAEKELDPTVQATLDYLDFAGDQNVDVIESTTGADLGSFYNFPVNNQGSQVNSLTIEEGEFEGDQITLFLSDPISDSIPSRRRFKVKAANKNIKVLGEIDNVEAFYNKVDIVIVPLLSGSGMRIKVIEAMAYKKPIISTSIGAEGINYRNNENIIIQDEENGFLNAITDLIKDRDKADKIAQKGLEHVHANFDNNQLIKKLLNHYA